jgi:hypothetical protein
VRQEQHTTQTDHDSPPVKNLKKMLSPVALMPEDTDGVQVETLADEWSLGAQTVVEEQDKEWKSPESGTQTCGTTTKSSQSTPSTRFSPTSHCKNS